MLSSLPVELLTSLLQQVHGASRESLVTCMRCNRRLYRTGFEILYKHVTLRIRDAVRFASSIDHLSTLEEGVSFPHIRSLRVVIPGDGRDYGGGGGALREGATKIIDPGIRALVEVLPLLVKLRTFSIMSYNGHRLNTFDECLGVPTRFADQTASSSRKPGPSINILAKLVMALPPSVRDLSIDLSELSRYEPVPQCDLCSAINHAAPQLEHLNLHLRSYCSHVLTITGSITFPKYPSLKSLILRIHGFNGKLCTQSIQAHHTFAYLDLDLFTRRMKELIIRGSLPSLKQCIIISKRRPHGIRQHPDAKWTIYVRELVSNQTAAIPRIFLDSRTPLPGNTFIASARTTIRLPSKCSFIDSKHWDKEYVGKSGSIRRFVEGLAGWVCFAHGPHIPGLRTEDIKAAWAAGYDVRAPLPSPVALFRKYQEKSCPLWDDEDAAGARLLEPSVWDGVLDNNVIRRHDFP